MAAEFTSLPLRAGPAILVAMNSSEPISNSASRFHLGLGSVVEGQFDTASYRDDPRFVLLLSS